MKYSLLLSYLLLSTTSIAQSSTFSGRVLSNSDNSPIPYAHIALMNKAIGAISDEDGFFTLSVPINKLKNGQFIVSAIGFNSLLINDMNPWNKELKLLPLIQELQAVTISANKFKLTAKDLVKSAIKDANKLEKSIPIDIDIEQVAERNGIITQHYFNLDVMLTREESISYDIPEIEEKDIEYSYDVGAFPTAWSVVISHWILLPDFFTIPKIKKAKGKYSFEFTNVIEIANQEAFEVIVLQKADTMSRSSIMKTDYKFYFSTKDYNLLRFEKREFAIFEQGYNHMYMGERTVSNYRIKDKSDPFYDISIESIQYITRYNRKNQVIRIDRGSQVTKGIKANSNSKEVPILQKEYLSTLDAIEKNTSEEKLYLYIFWEEAEDVFYDNRLALFQLLEDYTYDELEIVCIGSPQKRANWVLNAFSFPFFSHYYLDDLTEITANPSKQCQLFYGKRLISSSVKVSEKILNAITSEIKK